MAIAKLNIELNAGTLAVESTKGLGTTVTLRFQTAVSDDDASAL